ncbi:DUF3833 family protein [Parasphingorhabdus sp.]|uniref:DUF3833 family protein n=1 Tax=Parasphingorhabdus sp. TaxID=2709688 RepID=UPI003C75C75E
MRDGQGSIEKRYHLPLKLKMASISLEGHGARRVNSPLAAMLDFLTAWFWYVHQLVRVAGVRRTYFTDSVRCMFHIIAMCFLVQSLAGCASFPVPQTLASSSPVFDPLIFFSGRTEGRGNLKKILSSPIPVIVHGHGIMDDGGALVLNQEVLEGQKPPRKRSWRIHRLGDHSYGGSLSDASGPVKISVEGNRMHISFTMDGGFPVDQYIFLAADGQSAKNIMLVRKLGIRVAVLDEEIVKISR